MRILVDTNIILDYFLAREPFVEDATALIAAIESDRIVGYVTATTITNIFYIARKQTRNMGLTRQAISGTLRLMEICAVDSTILEEAFASSLTDFEDAVQLACAIAENLDAIITRDGSDFAGATLPIWSVPELFTHLR